MNGGRRGAVAPRAPPGGEGAVRGAVRGVRPTGGSGQGWGGTPGPWRGGGSLGPQSITRVWVQNKCRLRSCAPNLSQPSEGSARRSTAQRGARREGCGVCGGGERARDMAMVAPWPAPLVSRRGKPRSRPARAPSRWMRRAADLPGRADLARVDRTDECRFARVRSCDETERSGLATAVATHRGERTKGPAWARLALPQALQSGSRVSSGCGPRVAPFETLCASTP